MSYSHQLLYQGQSFRIYLDNQSIIKVLRSNAPNYSTALLYLQNEYDISHALDFQGIRPALHLGNFKQNPALFLKYAEGQSLQTFSQELSLSNILQLGIQLAEKLNYIHQKNIIHKDINPNNIIINPNNQEVTIIDFGIASRISQKQYHLGNPQYLEGTLRYISPEQTGRINKVVDYRTDLYSLGIVLYELLIGHVPFDLDDPMELVHAHITTLPAPIQKIRPDIPLPLSNIVIKLLEKNAEDRYQTALGLKHDLENCLLQLQENQTINYFELAKKDYSGKLQLPQKLYGREKEIQVLLDAFERVSQGGKEWLLVGGYSGVGKSVLVNEIHKPITEKRGYFISGKFDQYQRNIPYFALRKAFAELIQYWLLEEYEIVQKWKTKIQDVLGDLAKVVTEVIPELELLIGEPAQIPLLKGEQYANRFNYVFGLFMNVICSEEHPLVIFIDDWQWADSASLSLFNVLLADENLKNVLFIGAYRDNEVDDSHAFMQTLQSIEEMQITPVRNLMLKNLSVEHIVDWVQDSLQETKTEVLLSLVELIYTKTQGNAFFTSQFLQNLFDENLLYFDFRQEKWQWKIEEIEAQNITDNVVDLMTQKVRKLPSETQELLKIGACVGASFNIELISTVSGKSVKQCQKTVEPALLEGLLSKIDPKTYRFIHDRIQQATYGLLSTQEQKERHYTIGNIWLEEISEDEKEAKLIDIVSQLNFGLDFVCSPQEKDKLLNLNIEAGQKAKNAVAYTSAYEYFSIAGQLLSDEAWGKHYKKTFSLFKNWGEVAFLINKTEKSAQLLETALQNAQDKYDKVAIYILRTGQKNSQGNYFDASEEGIQALNLFGYNLPSISDQEFYTKAGEEEFRNYLNIINTDVPYSKIESLPLLTDKAHKVCTQLIVMLLDGVFLGVPYAFMFVAARGIILSLKNGQSGYLPALLANLCVAHAAMRDYDAVNQIIMKIKPLRSRFKIREFDARVYQLFGYNSLYSQPIQEGVKNHIIAFQKGFEVGDLAYSGYSIMVATWHSSPTSLANMKIHALTGEKFFKRTNNDLLLLPNYAAQGFFLNLQGQTNHPLTFSTSTFDEQQFIDTFMEISQAWLAVYKRLKLQVLVCWKAYDEAYLLVQERTHWLALLGGLDAEFKSGYYVFTAITVRVLYDIQKLSLEEASLIIQEAMDELERLYQVNPNLFEPMYALILAQKAELDGEKFEAMNHYDRAIQTAVDADLLMYVAVANEFAMRFYLSIEKLQIAQIYLSKAINYYQLWGATAKAKDLKSEYSHLYQSTIVQSQAPTKTATYYRHTISQATYSTTGQNLDVSTLLKASQTLSKEIQLESLLQKMLRILIENAGADKGILLLSENDEWVIQGEIYANGNQKVLHQFSRKEAHNLISDTVVNYVIHTKKLFVTDKAQQDNRLTNSYYIQSNAIQSILCLPLLNQYKLTGVLYLENSVSEGAFSNERVNLLTSLASQIAISIENAFLYEKLEEKVAQRTRRLAQQNDILFKQNNIIKSAHKKITASINYAERIQKAILPETRRIHKMLPENFIFFRPRDVVSGDFYWCTQSQKGEKVIFATADCTGHGVPGAFMSMIGTNLLTQIVNDHHITKPDVILHLLDERVRQSLQQDANKNRDGMDISISVIDWETKTLTYSGAKRPLYYIQHGEMHQIKGSRYAVGGYLKGIQRKYTTQEICFAHAEITAYTFSDGFPDQIGEKSNRKFMIKHFRELLFELSDQPLEVQKQELAQIFDEWKGSYFQLDDVLVVGMRLS